jgi:hypothetical protein
VTSPDASGSQLQGKSRFYVKYIRLSDNLVCGRLFRHEELRLISWPEDYGEMRVYSGSSSSGEMNSAKEESYQIARSLGATSSSRVIANVDYCTIGLLPFPCGASFADACAGSFSAPEAERDLLKVPNASLIEAVNFHAASVSFLLFSSICSIGLISYLRQLDGLFFIFAGHAADSWAPTPGAGLS